MSQSDPVFDSLLSVIRLTTFSHAATVLLNDFFAGDLLDNAAPRGFLIAQAAEREDEQNRRADIGDDHEAWGHVRPYFRNISSMRRVTAKPPVILMLVMRIDRPAIHTTVD